MAKEGKARKFISRVRAKHRRIKFIHFVTHMLGKLFLGMGIGALFFETLEPSVVALIFVGLLLHIPFWHEVYLKR